MGGPGNGATGTEDDAHVFRAKCWGATMPFHATARLWAPGVRGNVVSSCAFPSLGAKVSSILELEFSVVHPVGEAMSVFMSWCGKACECSGVEQRVGLRGEGDAYANGKPNR